MIGEEPRLHQVLGLARGVAALLTICDMAEFAVLKNGFHLDDTAPAARQDFLTFTSCVLRNITWHMRIPPINSSLFDPLYNIPIY